MAFCGKCGASVLDDATFCGKCGTKIVKDRSVCPNCGSKIEGGMFFCSKCGTRIGESSKPDVQNYIPPVPAPTVPVQSSTETELYRKKMIGYYKTIKQISGELLITNKRIVYTPMAMYILDKPFTINMSQVLNAARASVMGINLCIRVTTTEGKSHTFALGIQNSGDIQHVVDLINSAKQTN